MHAQDLCSKKKKNLLHTGKKTEMMGSVENLGLSPQNIHSQRGWLTLQNQHKSGEWLRGKSLVCLDFSYQETKCTVSPDWQTLLLPCSTDESNVWCHQISHITQTARFSEDCRLSPIREGWEEVAGISYWHLCSALRGFAGVKVN